jgi:lysozyme family protein
MPTSLELFKKALNFVAPIEGGYVNDPDDSGGATNKGVTQDVYDKYRLSKKLKVQSVKNITTADVEQIFYENYWLAAGCDKMSPRFAVLVFDTAINMGIGIPPKLLQAAHYKDVNEYLLERIELYLKYAKVKTQKKFLEGWLNRVFALRDFVNTL